MQPVSAAQRHVELDALRGAALFGVLMVNLLGDFRVSLFTSILQFHTHPGAANHVVDWLVSVLLEFKAFTLFALLFGVSTGLQIDRSGAGAYGLLLRRFLALLAIGLAHALLIWNGDILTLYAVCGLLLIPFIRAPVQSIFVAGWAIVLIAPFLPYFGSFIPSEEAMRAQSALNNRIYGSGRFLEVAALRVGEWPTFIVPLLLASFPRTLGLMLIGMAAARSGIFHDLVRYRRVLALSSAVCGTAGFIGAALEVRAKETGARLPAAAALLEPYASLLLAFAYAAAILFWLTARPPCASGLANLLAATGRMALTNYLAQSVLFSLLFYGFGFGLYGRLGSAPASLIGIATFIAQMLFSRWWLSRYRFGPAEWLWRSLTYRARQPFAAGHEL